MLRLVYLLLYVSSACLLSAGIHAAESRLHSSPNILILLADDFGYNDSAIYRDIFHQTPVASMPTLESFAKEGMRFTRFYTESTCSSSRAALLTGQYPARHGFMPVARGISPDVITLPEYLRSLGYQTYLVGKWHVGEVNPEAFPERQGFDATFGFLGQWFLKGPDKNGKQDLKSPTYNNPWLRETNQHGTLSYRQYQGHLEDILTDRTVHLIQQQNKNQRPWFIYHAFFAPHTPLEPAGRFALTFENTPQGKYKAMLAQMDENISRIFSALKESGQWDNTIIFFVSDNGSPDKASNSNAPFGGVKAEYEEGGIRTPLLIKWNKNIQSTATRNDVVSIMDIYPSLVSVVGSPMANLKKFDGIPGLSPSASRMRNTPLYFLTYGALSVLSADGHYRLLREWDAERFTRSQLFEYDQSNLPEDISGKWLENIFSSNHKRQNELFNAFLQWRNNLRVVPTTVQNEAVTGSDFLRTPMNPAFAVLFSFSVTDVISKQFLLSQQGVSNVYLENGVLHGDIHGLSVKAEGLKPNTCYSIVLSGEFYDRFSGVHNDIRSSHLHLIVNGKEVDTASGEINSLASVDITAPTYMGKISGVMTQPTFLSTQLLPNDKPIPSGFSESMDSASACREE